MRKILVPVDGSAAANRAVQHAIEHVRRTDGVAILLLNVQHTLEHWHRHGLINEDDLRLLRQHGEKEAAAARALLDRAGVSYELQILFGHPAEVIARVAKEQPCEAIVMGTRGLGEMENVFLGSVAYKVVQLADVPVTLVK